MATLNLTAAVDLPMAEAIIDIAASRQATISDVITEALKDWPKLREADERRAHLERIATGIQPAMARTRRAVSALDGAPKKRHHVGPHWTQTPKGRKILKARSAKLAAQKGKG